MRLHSKRTGETHRRHSSVSLNGCVTSTTSLPRTTPTLDPRQAAEYPTGALAATFRRRAGARAVGRDLLVVAAAAWLTMPVVIFLGSGGLATVGTAAGVLTGIGQLTGLLAASTMTLQVLLASRIPVVDRLIGHDEALRLHAVLNTATMGFVVAHGVGVLVGEGWASGSNPVVAFLDHWSLPDFVLAVLAFVLLCLVGATSAIAVRRALPHEVWWGIHALTYAAIVVSIPHQLSMGLLTGGWPRVVWVAMWGVTAFAVLTWRWFLPLFANLEHRMRVVHVAPEGPDAVSIVLHGRNLDRLRAKGGQFFHWRFLAPGLWTHQHPFSLSAAPRGDHLRITVRSLGRGTAALQRLEPGTRVWFQGPYGIFTDVARTKPGLIVAGAGAGICPLPGLLESTPIVPGMALVILRASNEQELHLAGEIARLCEERGARLVTLVGPRDGVHTWLPADHADFRLDEAAPWLADADLYACGPTAWTDALAAASSLPAQQIHTERYSW